MKVSELPLLSSKIQLHSTKWTILSIEHQLKITLKLLIKAILTSHHIRRMSKLALLRMEMQTSLIFYIQMKEWLSIQLKMAI